MGERLVMPWIPFEVWQWHGAGGRMLCKRENTALSPSTFSLKKDWFQIGPFWSKKRAGQLPGIALEDSGVRESQGLPLSVSTALSLLFPPSPRGSFGLFFLLGSELTLRMGPDRFRWQPKRCLTASDWRVQQSDRVNVADLTNRSFPWPHFPLCFFVLVVPFPLQK